MYSTSRTRIGSTPEHPEVVRHPTPVQRETFKFNPDHSWKTRKAFASTEFFPSSVTLRQPSVHHLRMLDNVIALAGNHPQISSKTFGRHQSLESAGAKK